MRLVPALAPEVVRHDFAREFGADTPVVRAAVYWRSLNELIATDAVRCGLDYRRFRFEDIFSGSDAIAREFADLSGGRPDVLQACFRGPRINASAGGHLDTAAEHWSALERRIVAEVCGELAESYGYGPWQELE